MVQSWVRTLANDFCLLSRMALEWCLNFLLSLLQWLDVQPEVDNSMKAIVPVVLLVASSCATYQPKSVDTFRFNFVFLIDTKICRFYLSFGCKITSTDFDRSKSSILIRTSPMTSFCEYRSQSSTCRINSLPGNWSRDIGNLKCWSKYGWNSPRWMFDSRLRLSTSGLNCSRTNGSRNPPSSMGHKLWAEMGIAIFLRYT